MFSCVALLSLFITLSAGAALITSRNPTLLPTSGGTIIGNGTNLGFDIYAFIFYTVGVEDIADAAIITPNTAFYVVVGPGVGANIVAHFFFNGFVDYYYTGFFSYQSPSIASVSPLPGEGGAITITGSNFGPSNRVSAMSITFNAGSQVYSCSSISFIIEHTKLTCTIAPGIGSGSIVLSIANQNATFSTQYNVKDVCNYALSTANRLSNPKFEDNPPSSSWTCTPNYPGISSIIPTTEHLGCGGYSAKVSGDGILAQSWTNRGSPGTVIISAVVKKIGSSSDQIPQIIYDGSGAIPTTGAQASLSGTPLNTWQPWRFVSKDTRSSGTSTLNFQILTGSFVLAIDDVRLCYNGESGCVWEILSMGALMPGYTSPAGNIVTQSLVLDGQKCLQYTENGGPALVAGIAILPPDLAFSTAYVVARASANTIVTFSLSNVGYNFSVTTTWATYTFSAGSSVWNPFNAKLPPGSGLSLYIANVWLA